MSGETSSSGVSSIPTKRRRFLELAGTSAVGLTFGTSATTADLTASTQVAGPPNPSEWSSEFEEQFDSGSLDDSKWSLGWGWGRTMKGSSTRMVPENVAVRDDKLRLQGTHDGENVFSGGINTKHNVEFGPGTYFEVRVKFADRTGFHPAIWAKPSNVNYLLEIDAVELLQDGSGRDDTHTSQHFLHYTLSTEPDDESTHEQLHADHQPGDDLTKNYHVYGAEWRRDSISFYVDGEKIQTFTDESMLYSMEKGAPFYINITQNINVGGKSGEWLGNADLSEPWGETTVVDWLRIWSR